MHDSVQRRRPMLAFGAMLIALAGIAGVHPAAAGSTLQAMGPVTITVTGAPTVAPGGTLSFAGNCVVGGGTQEAHVMASLVSGQGSGPFDFAVTLTTNPSTAAFSGSITVPGDAPNGTYALNVSCGYLDVVYGGDDNPASFTVDGPQITTTTSSTTTSTPTATSRPLRVAPHVDPGVAQAPQPAAAVRGTARLTG